MNIEEFKKEATIAGYDEVPLFNTGLEVPLKSFVNFETVDINLKMHLNKLILCRSFYGTHTAWYQDVEWFIQGFFKAYKNDFNRPELTDAIREAVSMIQSEEVFTKGVIATTFMFGVLEFYVKFYLGFRPMLYDFFDSTNKRGYIKNHDTKFDTNREISISKALNYLQNANLAISHVLSEIDAYTAERLLSAGIEAGRWIEYTISKRISLVRNSMAHGENHSFYSIGSYLVMLYILFHLHDEYNILNKQK